MSYDYYDKLDSVARDRYTEKLKACDLKECPYKISAGSWENNPKKWPSVQWPDVFSYLIESPGIYTKEAMKNYRSLEAHNYFVSGWVQTVFHLETVTKQGILMKANVKPSQRLNDSPHHPWVVCQRDGQVIAAHCDCMAGLGESCSHVAALLFKVEAAVRQGYTSTSCTEQLCQWNQCFVKKIEPDMIKDIKFYKESTRRKFAGRGKKVIKSATPEEEYDFVKTLSTLPTLPVVLSNYDEFCDPFVPKKQPPGTDKLPVNMRSLFSGSRKDGGFTLEKIKFTDSQNDYLETLTRGQSACTTWHEMRTGRITASIAHRFLHTNPKAPAVSLLKLVCLPQKPIYAPPLQWGKDKEGIAFETFCSAYKCAHNNVTVTKSGMRLSKLQPFIGASPDGLINCCCGNGVLEIKCPYKFRACSQLEMYADSSCCLTDENELKKTHEYYTQVQLQMYVFNVSFAQFALWTPNFCIITHVAAKLTPIWYNHVLPELVNKTLETKGTLKADVDEEKENELLYCYCQKPMHGKMIDCHGGSCEFKWFHLPCVKRKTIPKGIWYCKDCKKQQ